MLKITDKARLGLGVSLAFVILFSVPYTSTKSENEQEARYVALTYDDGPNPFYTEKILAVLEEENVHATFFLLGKNVEKYPELVKQIYDGGHMVGNHTYSHLNVSQASEEEVREEVTRTNELIYKSCGAYPEAFRPPFGCDRSKLAEDLHMLQVFWNVDPRDWAVQNTSAVVNHVLKRVQDGDIILMHDAYGSTVEATKRLIPKLREMGYEFVTVQEMLEP